MYDLFVTSFFIALYSAAPGGFHFSQTEQHVSAAHSTVRDTHTGRDSVDMEYAVTLNFNFCVSYSLARCHPWRVLISGNIYTVGN